MVKEGRMSLLGGSRKGYAWVDSDVVKEEKTGADQDMGGKGIKDMPEQI